MNVAHPNTRIKIRNAGTPNGAPVRIVNSASRNRVTSENTGMAAQVARIPRRSRSKRAISTPGRLPIPPTTTTVRMVTEVPNVKLVGLMVWNRATKNGPARPPTIAPAT